MNRLYEDVVELAGRIGPRGTGSAGERAAADYVAGRLTALGLPVSRTTFAAVSSQNAFPLASVALALGAVAAYPRGGAWRYLAAGLALLAGPLLWRAIRLSTSPLRPLLPKVCSSNVVARVAPRDQPDARIVLLAHLDTNRTRLAWRSGGARWLEPMTWLTLGMFGTLGVLYATGVVTGRPTGRRDRRHSSRRWPAEGFGRAWYASLLPAAYVAGMLVTLIRDERTPFSPGAHDNAASVAVALETARTLAERRLRSTEVVLAFTGAEETDHAGLYDLLGDDRKALRDDPAALRRAAFIGLEGLGSGRLVYLTRHGLCDHVRPDPGLLAAAEEVAARQPDLMAGPAVMIQEDEVTTLRRRGYRAICIAGSDPDTGTMPRWHRPDDTPDSVSEAFMERAAAFVRALLDELDASSGNERPGSVSSAHGEAITCARS